MTNKSGFNYEQVSALCAMYKVIPEKVLGLTDRNGDVNSQIKYGMLFVDKEYNPIAVDDWIFDIAKSYHGIVGTSINNTFYASFDKVTAKSRLELLVDQVIHYMGTYGREAIGLNPITLVPMDKIVVPDVDTSKLKITVIRVISDDEITSLIDHSFRTVTRPAADTVRYLTQLADLATIPEKDVKSFELQVVLNDVRGTVPHDPKGFLRYLIYKTTGETLVINNQTTVFSIKMAAEASGMVAYNLFKKADLVGLSSIFLRYKNIFLAFKAHENCSQIINKLRRMADTYHKPLSENRVQNYFQLVMNREVHAARMTIADTDLGTLVKLFNVILRRLDHGDNYDGVFNVRNGRSFCRANAYKPLSSHEVDVYNREYTFLHTQIVKKVRPHVQGKVFYIPDYVDYTMPTSEKQFIGNFPWGTVFHVINGPYSPLEHAVIGVQWENIGEHRVDIDLHAFTADGYHFGWDSDFYGDDGEVIYSGDMTNAPPPHGAAEAFFVKGMNVPVIFTVHEFCGPATVDFRFVVSAEDTSKDENEVRNCVMDPNKLLFAPVPLQFRNASGMTLGFFDQGDFYLYSGNLSNGIVPRKNLYQYISGIVLQQENKLKMHDVLQSAGATVIRTPADRTEYEKSGFQVIDLSPEMLSNGTLMNILGN